LINNFYFNYHRIKFSSFFIDSRLIQRFEFSLPTVITIIMSGLIAYKSSLRYQLDQQYLLCVVSVLSLQETVDSTLYSNIQTSISIVLTFHFTFYYSYYWSFI